MRLNVTGQRHSVPDSFMSRRDKMKRERGAVETAETASERKAAGEGGKEKRGEKYCRNSIGPVFLDLLLGTQTGGTTSYA